MAPTEILAEQHSRNFSEWIGPLGLKIISLMGADKGVKRTQKLESIASGEANIVIGTHALFQASVEDRPGVRYQCVVSYAPRARARDWLRFARSPRAAASAAIFRLVAQLTALENRR